jgi:hypothetical protein
VRAPGLSGSSFAPLSFFLFCSFPCCSSSLLLAAQEKEVSGKRLAGLPGAVARVEHGLHTATTTVVGGLKFAKNAIKTGVRRSVTTLSHLGHGGGGGGGAGAGAGAGAGGAGAEPAGSVATKLASTSRRLTQVAMQRLGRTEASQDEEYETLKEELHAMRVEFTTLNGHLQAFIGCIRSACPKAVCCVCVVCVHARTCGVCVSIVCAGL